MRNLGSTVLSAVWVAAGRTNAFYSGLGMSMDRGDTQRNSAACSRYDGRVHALLYTMAHVACTPLPRPSGLRDCPKAWDWCAAAAIGTAAGAHFRRFDSELPFHFAASSGLCCAGSAPLADSLEAVLREVTGGAPLVEGAEESAARGSPGAPSKS